MAKTDVANRLIWFKGQIMNVNNAMVNVLSPTSQFGLNVFEPDQSVCDISLCHNIL